MKPWKKYLNRRTKLKWDQCKMQAMEVVLDKINKGSQLEVHNHNRKTNMDALVAAHNDFS